MRGLTIPTSPRRRTSADDHSASSSSGGLQLLNNKKVNLAAASKIDWHNDISYAIKAGRWETIRGHLSLHAALLQASTSSSNFNASTSTIGSDKTERKSNTKGGGLGSGFWKKFSGSGGKTQNNAAESARESYKSGLLTTDSDGRTPLHVALASPRTPNDVLLSMIAQEPRAVAMTNHRGRYPLHFAVVHRHDISVIAELVDAYPAALAAADSKGTTPLAYALDAARRETNLGNAPRTFWMPALDNTPEAKWQEEQGERWGIVHWLLLSSATHPQTSLSVGTDKPMLVDALIHAAPPAVISLLIGASVMLLSHENRATAFAGSTLYSCIARHYPLTILMSLVSQCPKDVRYVRDETGMGLLSSLFISACFQQTQQQEQQPGQQLQLQQSTQAASAEEWVLSEHFYLVLEESIEDGHLPLQDAAFNDWWSKIEFLVSFTAGHDQLPKTLLLHAALQNVDTPPAVIRFLMALHPQSIQLAMPSDGSFPLYIVAGRPEYVPRKYELKTVESTLKLIVRADPSAVGRRHPQFHRFPLHAAIEAGRVWPELELLVESSNNNAEPLNLLGQRDPVTGLYPFLQAAVAYSRKDSFRWTCLARNQYSYQAWKALSDRQKASVILKVSEDESMERFTTIYTLLRKQPAVLEKILPRKQEAIQTARDAQGIGMVAAHFISWYYREDLSSEHEWVPHPTHVQFFCQALVSQEEDFTPAFLEWWTKLKFWIRFCCPAPHIIPKAGSSADSTSDTSIAVQEDDIYLLHAALFNSDTPPPVIELLLALFPNAVSTPLPGNVYPLHISAQTVTYTPRPFEGNDRGILELVFLAFPEAAMEVTDDGFLPLHLAVQSGKTWEDVQAIIAHDGGDCLFQADPRSGFYPFQLLAKKRTLTQGERMRFQYLARNRGKKMTAVELVKQIRHVQREYSLDVLGTIFEFLRRSADLVRLLDDDDFMTQQGASNPSCNFSTDDMQSCNESGLQSCDDSGYDSVSHYAEDDSVRVTTGSLLSGVDNSHYEEEGSESYLLGRNSSDSSSDSSESDDSSDSSHSASSVVSSQDTAVRGTAPLRRVLSENSLQGSDVFECDTSVLSTVDVMSQLSSSYSASIHRIGPLRSVSQDKNYPRNGGYYDNGGSGHPMFDPDDTEFSLSVAEFAEDSQSFDYSHHNKPPQQIQQMQEQQHQQQHQHQNAPILRKYAGQSQDDYDESEASMTQEEYDSDEDSEVYFFIRRTPRIKTKLARDQFTTVTLTKRPSNNLTPFEPGSSHGQRPTVGAEAKRLLQVTGHSTRSIKSEVSTTGSTNGSVKTCSNGTYVSLQSEDLKRIKGDTSMMWVGNQLYDKKLLGNQDTSNSSSSSSGDDSPVQSARSASSGEQTSSQKSDPQTVQQLEGNSSNNSDKSDKERAVSVSRSELSDLKADKREGNRNMVPGIAAYLKTNTDRSLLEDSEVLSNTPSTLSYLCDASKDASTSSISHSEKSPKDASSSPSGDETSLPSSPEVSPKRSRLNETFSAADITSTRSMVNDASTLNELAALEQLASATTPYSPPAAHSSTALPTNTPFADVKSDGRSILTRVESTKSAVSVDSNSTWNEADQSTAYFDKVTMRWIKRPAEKLGPPADIAIDASSVSKQADDADSITDEQSNIYFDSKTMRWKLRSGPLETVTEVPKVQKPMRNGRTPGHMARIGMPFVDVLSRDDIKRRNQAYANAQRGVGINTMGRRHSVDAKSHRGVGFSAAVERSSVDAIQTADQNKALDAVDPVDKKISPGAIRSTWKHMFDVTEKNLSCLLCHKHSRQVLMVPCRHLAICRQCSMKETDMAFCPVCKSPSTDRMLLF